jgi:hypothetical protein
MAATTANLVTAIVNIIMMGNGKAFSKGLGDSKRT